MSHPQNKRCNHNNTKAVQELGNETVGRIIHSPSVSLTSTLDFTIYYAIAEEEKSLHACIHMTSTAAPGENIQSIGKHERATADVWTLRGRAAHSCFCNIAAHIHGRIKQPLGHREISLVLLTASQPLVFYPQSVTVFKLCKGGDISSACAGLTIKSKLKCQ